jgi:hypothetical protein
LSRWRHFVSFSAWLRSRTWSFFSWCENDIPPWWFKPRNLYGAASRLCVIRPWTSHMLVMEELVRIETSSAAMV